MRLGKKFSNRVVKESEHFILPSLVLGNQEDYCRKDNFQNFVERESARSMQGQVIQFTDLLKHVWGNQPLLIYGEEGVGKSVLIHEIMKRWAQNKLGFVYEEILLFNVRDLMNYRGRKIVFLDFLKNHSNFKLDGPITLDGMTRTLVVLGMTPSVYTLDVTIQIYGIIFLDNHISKS